MTLGLAFPAARFGMPLLFSTEDLRNWGGKWGGGVGFVTGIHYSNISPSTGEKGGIMIMMKRSSGGITVYGLLFPICGII